MNWTHSENPATVYALATWSGRWCLAATEHGLWQFDPQSLTRGWRQIAPQFAQVPLSAVAAHGNTIIVGSGGGIAVSRDGGATYALATLPVQAHVTALALSPTFDRDPLALAATVQDGVLRSADGGATWHAWNFGLLDLGTNALALSPNFAEDATCFAATDHGVFMSSNSGRAWSELPIGIDNGPFTALAVKTHERAPLQLHLGTEGNGLWIASAPYEKWQRAKGLRADEINYVLPDVAATTKGVFVADGGKWAKSLDVEDGVCLAKLDDGAVIAGTAGNGVWHAEP